MKHVQAKNVEVCTSFGFLLCTLNSLLQNKLLLIAENLRRRGIDDHVAHVYKDTISLLSRMGGNFSLFSTAHPIFLAQVCT